MFSSKKSLLLSFVLLTVATTAKAQQTFGGKLTCNGASIKYSVSGVYITEKKKEDTGAHLTWEIKGTVKPGSTVNVSMERTAGKGESRMAIVSDYRGKDDLTMSGIQYQVQPKTSDSRSISISNNSGYYTIILDFDNKNGNSWSHIKVRMDLEVTDATPPTTGNTPNSHAQTSPNGRTNTGSVGLVFTYNNLHYKILSKKTVEVTGELRGNYEGRVEIPTQVKHNGVTYQVVGIGQKAFYDQTKMTEVVIPKTIQRIEGEAFYNTGLTEVIVPGDSVSVKKRAFLNCRKLITATLNGKKPQCSASAFEGCIAMKELRIRGIASSNNGKKLKGTNAVIKVIK